VWGRNVDGLVLTFHLAGINNQNFLMKDDQTGTYWQQISGRAISGPLAGKTLKHVPSDELTFAVWKSEQPNGVVLKEIPRDVPGYAPKDWEKKLSKEYGAVLNFPEHGLESRDIMLTLNAYGEARAWRYEQVRREQLVVDRVGSEPVLLLLGPDNESVRAFHVNASDLNGTDFYRTVSGDSIMTDSTTGSHWNFHGCAIDGKMKGACLEPLPVMKDFWFDWRNYHPNTTVYTGAGNKIGRGTPSPADN
jgi:hypothetical protein